MLQHLRPCSRALHTAADLLRANGVRGRAWEPQITQITIRLILREQKGPSFYLIINASDRKPFSRFKGSAAVTVSNRTKIKVISAVLHELTDLKFASLPPPTAVI